MSDASLIVSKFKEYAADPANSKDVLSFKGDVDATMKMVSDVSAQAKTGVKFLNRLGFSRFKTFANGYLESVKKDIQSMADYATAKIAPEKS